MNREIQFQLQAAREAKQFRDEAGRSDAKADRVLEYYEAGIHDLVRHGIDPMAQTPAEWLAAHGKPVGELTRNAVPGDADTGEFNGRRGGEAASNQFGTFTVHEASPKQIAFVKRLLASKDYSALTPALKVPADLDSISKKSASALIDRLTGCPDKAGAADPAAPLASDKQMGFLRKLIAERDYYSLSVADRAKVDQVNAGATPTKRGASALIDTLTTTAYADRPQHAGSKPVANDDEPTELGMYRQARTGDLFRVYPAREGGHLLAKRLIVHDDGTASFMYAGAAKRNVKASERMTLEEAKAFGHQFGVCCMCAALLTDPESVANGIGPVCASKV